MLLAGPNINTKLLKYQTNEKAQKIFTEAQKNWDEKISRKGEKDEKDKSFFMSGFTSVRFSHDLIFEYTKSWSKNTQKLCCFYVFLGILNIQEVFSVYLQTAE